MTNINGEVINLYVQWVETFDYKINNYYVDETNNYLSKILENTDLNTFKSNIILAEGYKLNVDIKAINDLKFLYTGGKIKITYGQNLYKEFTNVVIGDGMINSADLFRVKQHLLGTKSIE